MNSPVQQIKERLSIEEVVSSYIKLEKVGSNLKAKCPFHNEKTPSFFISADRGTYYCFGCGASGDIFTFVEEFEGLDFKGALKLLAERAGVPLTPFTKESREAESEKEKLYRAMEESTLYFEKNLSENPEGKSSTSYGTGKEVFEYLKARGLTEKSIKDFRIGFAKLDWRLLYDHLKSRGFTDKEIERAGLAKKPDDANKAMYDRFRGRIMFPISDSSGRVIAFSGRIFVDDEKSAKYLNSPETPIFSKSNILYGLDKAKESIRKNNFSILVEGQMDLVLSHQVVFRNTIAVSGTAFTEYSLPPQSNDDNIHSLNISKNTPELFDNTKALGIVKRLSNNIVLAFDADKAGINATMKAGMIALLLGMDVKVVDMPEGVDPADLISKNGADAWREAIKNSKHIIEFLLYKVLKNYQSDMRKAGREIKEKILPFVNALSSSIEKTYFIKKIGSASGIPEQALEEDLKILEKEFKQEKEEIEEAKEALKTMYRKDYIERKLLGIILWQKTLEGKERIESGQGTSTMLGSGIDTGKILEEMGGILGISPSEIIQKTENSREDLIFEAEIFYGEGADINKDTEEMLANLKEEYLKEELGRKMRELQNAENSKDSQKSAQILKECQILNSKIQEIKNSRLRSGSEKK